MNKRILILSVLLIAVLAGIDAANMLSKQEVAIKTPAQVEMPKDMIRSTRDDAKQQLNPDQQVEKTRDNLFNERLKDQQNNNIPQVKQKNIQAQ